MKHLFVVWWQIPIWLLYPITGFSIIDCGTVERPMNVFILVKLIYPHAEWHKVWFPCKLFWVWWWYYNMEWFASSWQEDNFFDNIQANTSDCTHYILYWKDVGYRNWLRICLHEDKLGEVTWSLPCLDEKPFMMGWIWHMDRQKRLAYPCSG